MAWYDTMVILIYLYVNESNINLNYYEKLNIYLVSYKSIKARYM